MEYEAEMLNFRDVKFAIEKELYNKNIKMIILTKYK